MRLPPDLQVITDNMIKASMGLADTVMVATVEATVALSVELERQHGMAGDDDAGAEFAKVYKQAASKTLDFLGHSAYIIGESGKGLMRTVREFMARESEVASAILQKQVDLTYTMGDPGQSCDQRFLGLGQELPEVVGETSSWDQYAPGGMSDRFRGSPEKLRDVAGSWRAGGRLINRLLTDAQTYADTANKAHSGEAAKAFRRYFANNVGFVCPNDQANPDEPLFANLVAACTQLSKACDRYADHVENAKENILRHKTEPFSFDLPWDSPMFGGNGYDGGLKDVVLNDSYIRDLGDVAHALDSSEKRTKLPPGSKPDRPLIPGLPLLPVPWGAPVPVVVASYHGQAPSILPMGSTYDPNLDREPIPPAPGSTRILSLPEQQRFDSWVHTLPAHGFAGGGGAAHPDNAYQLRVAGYPEREVPLPPGVGKSRAGLKIDGMRKVDGYAIDAKHVRDPESCKSFRSISKVNQTLGTPPKIDPETQRIVFDPHRDGMYVKDANEMARYRAALEDPRNDEIRGFEIVTNDKRAAPYWQSMMAMSGVNGTARYVP
ncbi:restriction endonuclease fold toxin-2 domain-containing protein [Streptomyces sp. NPDC048193]|uniref:restriction endonuclease fold toxin-2 domain-containing protein n=1 Tax=unclassified Streptomyces TaxID=2593676 RepID=UPI00343EDD6C